MSSKILWRETLRLWLFCVFKIPLIWWLKPKVLVLSDSNSNILMPFKHRTRNHVGSMYFGAICVGAELAAGLLTIHLLQKQIDKFSFIIKDYQGHFYKRFEEDTHFVCEEGHLIVDTIKKIIQTNERQNIALNVIATIPTKFGKEPVGRFMITISIKKMS